MSVITTREITKRYGSRIGVDRISLDVPEGSIFGFLGPNGAGKTTAIRLMLGFLRPTEGKASIFGLDCWKQSHLIKREVGYVPGDMRLYPWLTVRRALRIARGVRREDMTRRGLTLADRFHIDPDLVVRKMSRGMRQKLGLIMALAHEPKLLVLDEPSSGLDPLMQESLSTLLRERAGQGCTVFFSSHTLSEVEQLCDRVAIVRAGRIVSDEALDDLRQRARRELVIRFATARDAQRIEPPAFFRLISREGDRWSGELDGEAGRLCQWMSGLPIRDFTIGLPDLNTIFRAHYQEHDGGAD